jgi:anti-sigma-K factor RskA
VVGTLPPRARAWVERRMRRDVALVFAITAWQDHLARWVELLAPVEPRPEVWESWARRIGGGIAPATAPAVETAFAAPIPPRVPQATRWIGSLPFWRTSAAFASAAALALAIGLGIALQPAPPPTHSAVFADGQGRPVWILEATLPEGRLGLRAFAAASPPPDRAYELWMLPSGGAPVSLGLLPASGVGELRIPAALAQRLLTAAGLAVSLEPAGGSPTGQPTGPVVYQASLVRT